MAVDRPLRDLGLNSERSLGLGEFLAFVAILFVAYVYIWRKGALEWH